MICSQCKWVDIVILSCLFESLLFWCLFFLLMQFRNRRRQRFFPLSGGLRFLSHSPHSVASDTTYVFQQEPILGRFKLRR